MCSWRETVKVCKAAQNNSFIENTRKNVGGEADIAIGPGGFGVYASVNIGKGDLEREGKQQQEVYLYAGNQLGFTSGQDTNIAGATLRGNDVVGRVGRDLNVTSLPDTGKVEGKEFDLSATVVAGFGGSVSGSVGYGQTNGSKNWIEEQTSITAKDKVDIRTENHTQLDGALIASDSGNLKLDTNTLGYSDIAGKDKEHGYYLNVGGSYGTSGSTTQDSTQVGKGDDQKNGWSVEGWNYNKDREQIVRGTVGAGDVVVRSDTVGKDSTAGLNRDVDKAYEITRDDEHRTDLYVTKSSLDAVASPKETLGQWQKNAALYGENSRNTIDKLADMLVVAGLLPLGAVTGNGTDLAQSRVGFSEMMRQLNSLDEGKRSAGVKKFLNAVAGKDLGSDAESLVARIAELGEEHPDQAMQAMVLLAKLNKPNGGASSFVPAVALGAGAIVALSAALSTTAATPEGQDRLRAAANAVALSVAESGQSAEQQVSASIEIWKFLFSTTFPVHLLDGENSRLVNPIVQAQGANPSSGGYAAGATPAGVGSTGGSQIADQTPVDYSRPVTELPAPGVMNQGIEDGAKELGRVDPPIPKVDVTNDFMMNVFKDGGVQLKYGDPDGVAGLVVNVDKAGVLGFEIRAAQNHPYYDASGTDMFASAMQRLGNEGIKVNQIRGAWEAGTDSVNTARYLENIANGMSKENAALNTWTGQIAQKYGYGKVEKIETIGDINYVTFKK